MGLFDRIFGSDFPQEVRPNIRFGRYTDAYKKSEKYEAWDHALTLFENEEYVNSYKVLLDFLRDEQEDNVHYREYNGGIQFEILQGSKKLVGFANIAKFKVETKLAKADALNINFMRRLIELNYDLEYGRYCLDDDQHIAMVFDTYAVDASPYKLYYALKEVATKADKMDDLLLDEFQMLRATDKSLQIPIPDLEKEIKYQFIIRSIKSTFEEIEKGKLDPGQYPGAIAYRYLDLCYLLDYLIKPEGFMMESLERIHRIYFEKKDKSLAQKNLLLRKEFQKLLKRSKKAYFKEMYRVNSTFGITVPVHHDRVKSFIDGELNNMDWYQENGYKTIALAIPGYIVGYCLFYYSVPQPDRDLFHLYYQITQSDYFKALGFRPVYYKSEKKNFNERLIKNKIEAIAAKYQNQFPRLKPRTRQLKFSSLINFARSYLLMIQQLDMTRTE